MAIADIHQDIIKTHILTRLDGQTLSAAACVSLQLQSLCSDDKLWSGICSANWPSTDDPLVRQAISNFPSGHRSFFSDSYPFPSHRLTTTTTSPSAPTSQIISAVDLRYHDELVFSKVESTNITHSDWFRSSPFRIDLLEPKELVPSAVKFSGDDHVMQSNLEKHMTLSWILIDPIQHRAVNLSSIKPVSVHRNWLTDDIELTFAVVTATYVKCNIEMTCGVKEGSGEVYVSGVSLTVQDVDGKCLNGKDSMVILQGLAVAQRRSRKHSGGGEEERDRYKEYIQRRRERDEKTERRERRLDMACVVSGVAFFVAFWSFALF
ncbi:F-box protein At2g27310-like [Cynara cardunculus var. scolymus]|uniref:F-box domain-containing protein n=1 Tax=Cynara cardunculus var. scolymus TaxID=59895 RepID=A0A103Y180_CYNCS|nr:F-box protein At2g27310-like [Cynara cardunculus var. scolymus]KVI00656.1 hypothetical protein Ccrd_021092 [Cynara cardunculus var. scolymus]